MSGLRSSRDKYDKIFIEKSCTIRLDLCNNSRRNLDTPGLCPFIWVSYQYLLRRLFITRENFGLRGAVHGYPQYRLLLRQDGIGWQLCLSYLRRGITRGWAFWVSGCFFWVFLSNKNQNKSIGRLNFPKFGRPW